MLDKCSEQSGAKHVPNVPNVPHVPNVPNTNIVPVQHRVMAHDLGAADQSVDPCVVAVLTGNLHKSHKGPRRLHRGYTQVFGYTQAFGSPTGATHR